MTDIQNIIFWYSKNWYKTTGNRLDDLKFILKDVYNTDGWTYGSACEIILDAFEDLIKKNLRRLINETVFHDRFDTGYSSEKRCLYTMISIIGLAKSEEFDSIDESFKNKFELVDPIKDLYDKKDELLIKRDEFFENENMSDEDLSRVHEIEDEVKILLEEISKENESRRLR